MRRSPALCGVNDGRQRRGVRGRVAACRACVRERARGDRGSRRPAGRTRGGDPVQVALCVVNDGRVRTGPDECCARERGQAAVAGPSVWVRARDVACGRAAVGAALQRASGGVARPHGGGWCASGERGRAGVAELGGWRGTAVRARAAAARRALACARAHAWGSRRAGRRAGCRPERRASRPSGARACAARRAGVRAGRLSACGEEEGVGPAGVRDERREVRECRARGEGEREEGGEKRKERKEKEKGENKWRWKGKMGKRKREGARARQRRPRPRSNTRGVGHACAGQGR